MSNDHEEFEEWLSQGGQARVEEDRAQSKAMRRQRIRSGDLPRERLVRLLEERLARFKRMADIPVVPHLVQRHMLNAVEESVKEIRLSLEAEIDRKSP